MEIIHEDPNSNQNKNAISEGKATFQHLTQNSRPEESENKLPAAEARVLTEANPMTEQRASTQFSVRPKEKEPHERLPIQQSAKVGEQTNSKAQENGVATKKVANPDLYDATEPKGGG